MFGFFRRRRQRLAAERAARIADASAAVHEKLTAEIAAVVSAAIAESGAEPENATRLRARSAALQRGVDMVLLDGQDAFEPALSSEDDATRVGAMLANAAVNITLASGSLAHPDSTGDIRHGLGLPRE